MAQRQEDDTFTQDEAATVDDERRRNAEAAGLSTADLAERARSSGGEDATEAEDSTGGPDHAPLLPEEDLAASRQRWTDIQAAFVDEPRRSVKEADQLVAQLMAQLAERFSGERSRLEGQWDRGDDVSTEDLRLALQRYRSFFERLLAA